MMNGFTQFVLGRKRTLVFFAVMGVLLLAACRGAGGDLQQSKGHPGVSDLSNADLRALADSLYARHEYYRAIPVLDECIRRKMSPDEMLFRKGVSLHSIGRIEDAVQIFLEAVEQNPNHVKAHYNLGATYYELREFERSISSYDVARSLEPTDDQIVYGVAASQFALGLYAKSRENAETALRMNPENENAKALMAMLNARN
ncbi:MAG: tetratricopeptide repeat protein [Pyrinomonadaceae bacterium]